MPINPNQFNAYANYPGANQSAFQMPMQNQMAATPQFGASSFGQQSGLSIAQITDDSQVTSYPVAAGNTVLLINFMTQKFFLKSTNVNGVPMPVQAAEWNYIQQPGSAQNFQNEAGNVTRGEFEELKGMLAQVLSNQQARNQKYAGQPRGGKQNDQPRNDPAGNV